MLISGGWGFSTSSYCIEDPALHLHCTLQPLVNFLLLFWVCLFFFFSSTLHRGAVRHCIDVTFPPSTATATYLSMWPAWKISVRLRRWTLPLASPLNVALGPQRPRGLLGGTGGAHDVHSTSELWIFPSASPLHTSALTSLASATALFLSSVVIPCLFAVA